MEYASLYGGYVANESKHERGGPRRARRA
eukprot:SAG31_NODE_3914_length_3756_cov_1.638228_1_plen_28_part_10